MSAEQNSDGHGGIVTKLYQKPVTQVKLNCEKKRSISATGEKKVCMERKKRPSKATKEGGCAPPQKKNSSGNIDKGKDCSTQGIKESHVGPKPKRP